MPMADQDASLEHKDMLAQTLNDIFMPAESDVIIITSASERKIAQDGAIAAALTLVK